MKKVLSLALVLILMLSLVSCAPKSKEFSKEGMTITLTNSFWEKSVDGYTICYDSRNDAVFVLKEAFSLLDGAEDLTLDEYAEMVRKNNASRSPSEIKKEEGLTIMEYTFLNESNGITYAYLTTMFKTSDAFWLIQFTCEKSDYDTRRASYIEWAKSVKFDK